MAQRFPVTANDRRIVLNATLAGQTAFDGDFPIQRAEDVLVEVRVGNTGPFSPLTYGSQYGISGVGQAAGFSVSLTTGRAVGDQVRLTGRAQLARTQSVVRNGKYNSQATDDDLDRVLMTLQEFARDVEDYGDNMLLQDDFGHYDAQGRLISNLADAVEETDAVNLKTARAIASLPGAPGDKGPQGDIGPTGPTGPQGAVGPTGPQGPQGPDGDQGPAGIVGPQGPQGLTGPTGNQGPQGIVGPQGLQGPAGPAGPQGPQGALGPTGNQGPQGAQGDEGPMGPAGQSFNPNETGPFSERSFYDAALENFSFVATDTGTIYWKLSNAVADWSAGTPFGRGPQGSAGPQGAQGVQGPKGDTGDRGINWQGEWSDVATYALHDAVYHAPTGSAYVCILAAGAGTPVTSATYWQLLAAQGATGPEGPQGPQGAVGPNGPQGNTGPQGVQGPQGNTGPQGVQGATGPTGATGATGPQGGSGPTGPQGSQGPAGARWMGEWSSAVAYVTNDIVYYLGSSYISKLAGTNKVPSNTTYWALLAQKGATGPQGATGAQGPQGVQGAQGATGATGPTGPQGPQGAAAEAPYLSPPQTITNGGLLTLAHTRSATPTKFSFRLQCVVAEAGWSVGDKPLITFGIRDGATRVNSVWADTTNVYVRFSNSPTTFEVGNKDTGHLTTITNARWRLLVQAEV